MNRKASAPKASFISEWKTFKTLFETLCAPFCLSVVSFLYFVCFYFISFYTLMVHLTSLYGCYSFFTWLEMCMNSAVNGRRHGWTVQCGKNDQNQQQYIHLRCRRKYFMVQIVGGGVCFKFSRHNDIRIATITVTIFYSLMLFVAVVAVLDRKTIWKGMAKLHIRIYTIEV